MKIDGDIAIQLSAHASYLKLIGMDNKVLPKNVNSNTGTRFLKERGYRTTDLHEIIKQLDLGANKFMIMRLLGPQHIYKLLGKLDKNMLINGLQFFSKEQLLRIIQHLPPEMVMQMLLQSMSIRKLIEKMPLGQMLALLRSPKIDLRTLIKALANLELKYLQFLLMKMTGKDASHLQKNEILSMFRQFKKREFLGAIKHLPWKALIPLMESLTKNDPTILESLSAHFVSKLFSDMGKQMTIQAFYALPQDRILRCFDQLTDKSLMMIATQIDDNMLSDYLIAEQPELLLSLAAVEAA